MSKSRILKLLIFCVAAVFFAACTVSPDEFLAHVDTLATWQQHSFTAVGTVSFAVENSAADTYETEEPASVAPFLRYAMTGVRCAESGRIEAQLYYFDGEDMPRYDMALLHDNAQSYVTFTPLLQHVLSAAQEDTAAADLFSSNAYLAHPTLDPSSLFVDLPGLIAAVEPAVLRRQLRSGDDIFELTLTGEQFPHETATRIVYPFLAANAMRPLVFDGYRASTAQFAPFYRGDPSDLVLALTLAYNTANASYTLWLTLTAPEIGQVTMDITYQTADEPEIAIPPDALTPPEIHETFAAYLHAREREQFLHDSAIEFDFDLPEVHLTSHQLEEESFLIPYEIEIGGETHVISLITDAINTSTDDMVYSIRPGLSLVYAVLESDAASVNMAIYSLIYLDEAGIDGINYQRTPMRVNAHDTAAVMALIYDDNHMGRALHIYVLQNIADSDYALFLSIPILLEYLTIGEQAVLEELGFHIGLDFLEFLTLAAEDAGEDAE